MAIGNYKSKEPLKVQNAPSSAAAPAKRSTPASTVADAVQEGMRADVRETGEVADKALSYEDVLKAVDLTREQAYVILDAVLLEDVYTEVIALTPKVSVTFRTRVYQDTVRYHQNLERYQPRYETQRDETRLRYNLAASLAAFRGESFRHPDPKTDPEGAEREFLVRHDFVRGLPELTVDRLCNELYKFDKRVYAALNEGAVEFF